jgi:hypothetical protein
VHDLFVWLPGKRQTPHFEHRANHLLHQIPQQKLLLHCGKLTPFCCKPCALQSAPYAKESIFIIQYQ